MRLWKIGSSSGTNRTLYIVIIARQKWRLMVIAMNVLDVALYTKRRHTKKRGEKMDEDEVYWFFIECDDDKMKEFEQK